MENNEVVNQENTQLTVIEKSIVVFKSAPIVLNANQQRSELAVKVGNAILNIWQNAWAITDAEERIKQLKIADEKSNKYILNCSTALKEENEQRAAITQVMDNFKKMFTVCENQIDKSKPDSVPALVQQNRNKYAKEELERQEKIKQEAEWRAKENAERIEIQGKITLSITSMLSDSLLQRKLKMQNAFHAITLDNFDEKSTALKGLKISQPDKEQLLSFLAKLPINDITAVYLSKEIVELIKKEAIDSYDFSEFTSQWVQELIELQQKLVDELGSKREELNDEKLTRELAEREKAEEAERQRIEKEEAQKFIDQQKDIATKKRLEEELAQKELENKRILEQKEKELAEQAERDKLERELRERQDTALLQEQAKASLEKKEFDLSIKQTGEHTMNMFDQEMELAENTKVSAKVSMEITVEHSAGLVQIFQLWYEKEGKNLEISKALNTKIDQMKTWCEKYYDKTGEKIDSKFLKYEPKVSAKTTKIAK